MDVSGNRLPPVKVSAGERAKAEGLPGHWEPGGGRRKFTAKSGRARKEFVLNISEEYSYY